MSPIASLGNGLQAAMLLARGRADGATLLAAGGEPAMATAARSFWAMAICLPAFLCLFLIDLADATPPPDDPAHALAAQLLAAVVAWLGYALATHRLAEGIGRAARWPHFIALLNWCSVVQLLLLIAARAPGLLGAGDVVAETADVVVLGWSLWLEWFVTRVGLGVSGQQAVAFVLLDTALTITCNSIAAGAGG